MNTGIFRATAIVLLFFTLAACDPAPQDVPETGEAPAASDSDSGAPLEVGEHQWTTDDGNTVPYTVTGEGDATVVLVHCWMCDRTFWSEQVPALSEHYRTIALDLPGHGEATANRENWTVSAFGEDVAGLIEDLGLDNVVLVGHSMGGPVSLRAAAQLGDRVRGIVAVDTLHNADAEFSGEQVDAFISAMEADFEGTCSGFVQQMFPEEGVDETMAQVQESSCAEGHAEAGTALIKDFGRIDMGQWMSEAGVPIRAINAAAPNPTLVEVNRKYADFDAVLVEDVGHYLHMTRPEKFNPLLLAAIDGILLEARQ
ncbi:MAG TPA: alpha/beta hydrolase [Woeseiaceae bacterium]|nr:alpha/beta hydrolase [Woeseiaceae bacterium]